jgi:hypothetical protein
MNKLRRLAGVTAISTIILGTLGVSPSVAATPEGPVAVQGLCSGNSWARAKVTVSKAYIRDSYYGSTPVVKTVYSGATMAVFDDKVNEHDNMWWKVQYSDRTNDDD